LIGIYTETKVVLEVRTIGRTTPTNFSGCFKCRIEERVAWLLSGAYKVLRSIPRRDFIKRVEEEEDEPNKRLERWLG
jgi:hypothetical protein